MKSDAERQRVTQCLEAAIERRVSEVSALSYISDFGSMFLIFVSENCIILLK